jgi:hypothetical protein
LSRLSRLRRGGASERVDAPERGGHRLEGRRHGGVLRRLRLKLGDRGLKERKRGGSIGRELRPSGALDLMQRAHRLSDRCGKLEQALRNVGIRLEGVEASRERFSGDARERDGVGHGLFIS